MKIGELRVNIFNCTTGVYLRWWFNGWHYFNFQNGYEITMTSESMDTQVTKMFSIISKIEGSTRLKAEYSYQITLEGITASNINAFTGLLLAEKVEQYEGTILHGETIFTYKWYEVNVTRGDHLIKNENAPGYMLNFEITRKERPYTSTTLQKTIKLYLGDTLCDLDEDEVVPINKQVNNIAEMQDRQSDFTAQFRIRKTRLMRALFELSGEVGASTDFPYKKQVCRMVQDGIEMITAGEMFLDKVDDQYYYVSIYSGNLNFFKVIDKLKLINLDRVAFTATIDHTWEYITQAATHASDLNYVYPLCEPSKDGSLIATRGNDNGDSLELFGGWLWPFIKVKALWDEIFTEAGYYVEGDILSNDIFLNLFMPITNLKPPSSSNTSEYLYSLSWQGMYSFPSVWTEITGQGGLITVIKGESTFPSMWQDRCHYEVPYTADYKFRIEIVSNGHLVSSGVTYALDGIGGAVPLSLISHYYTRGRTYNVYTGECSATYLQILSFFVFSAPSTVAYSISITEIVFTTAGYSIPITPLLNLPDLTQIDFIKMICNMFALIPDVTARDHKIKFWNYSDLYDNIAIARDWSAYLSEREDETEFKFGDYAQDNYLRYKQSDDVIIDNGKGSMRIEDDTLPMEKEVIELPISTCDEVNILPCVLPIAPHNFQVTVSRLALNVYNADTDIYDNNQSIDPRIVFIDRVREIDVPLYQKELRIRNQDVVIGSLHEHILTPRKASSLEVSFSSLVVNYASLSRLLTKTNLRRAKFNLPVYEVAGLKHYIPIYLSQYKAYFYVNKINNYVPGKLCTIDLIKL